MNRENRRHPKHPLLPNLPASAKRKLDDLRTSSKVNSKPVSKHKSTRGKLP